MRSSFCALPTSRLEPTPRAKLDFAAAPSPARAAVAAGKENRHVDDEVSLDLTAMAMPTPMPTWTASPLPPPTSPLFERGRLYDLYSARRNERLKRKHGFPAGEEEAEAMAADPCVAVELSKRRGAKKMTGAESVRRSMPAAADFSAAGRAATSTLGLRSSLRSSKEMKKTSAASSSFAGAKSPAAKERRASTRSSARRFWSHLMELIETKKTVWSGLIGGMLIFWNYLLQCQYEKWLGIGNIDTVGTEFGGWFWGREYGFISWILDIELLNKLDHICSNFLLLWGVHIHFVMLFFWGLWSCSSWVLMKPQCLMFSFSRLVVRYDWFVQLVVSFTVVAFLFQSLIQIWVWSKFAVDLVGRLMLDSWYRILLNMLDHPLLKSV